MTKNISPSHKADKYIIRFPEGMRAEIANAASANNRSINAEIVARLESTFQSRHQPSTTLESQFLITHVQADLAAMALRELDLRDQLSKVGQALASCLKHLDPSNASKNDLQIRDWQELSENAMSTGAIAIDELKTRLSRHAAAVIKKAEVTEKLIVNRSN